MITSKQRAYLRSIAQNLQPIFQIGKNGVNDNQIEQLKKSNEIRKKRILEYKKKLEADSQID